MASIRRSTYYVRSWFFAHEKWMLTNNLPTELWHIMNRCSWKAMRLLFEDDKGSVCNHTLCCKPCSSMVTERIWSCSISTAPSWCCVFWYSDFTQATWERDRKGGRETGRVGGERGGGKEQRDQWKGRMRQGRENKTRGGRIRRGANEMRRSTSDGKRQRRKKE